jgi:hypothetical protein
MPKRARPSISRQVPSTVRPNPPPIRTPGLQPPRLFVSTRPPMRGRLSALAA